MAKYTVHGNYRPGSTDFFPYSPEVTIEVADLLETPSGRVWSDGAHRVKAPGHRTRVFKGEMAWADAERYAGDIAAKIQRERNVW